MITGDYLITHEFLQKLGACNDGLNAFEYVFPIGGEYQEVLDMCATRNEFSFGTWLLEKVGPTTDIRTYKEEINDPDLDIIFAGKIIFNENINVNNIRTGDTIRAHKNIKSKNINTKSINVVGNVDADNITADGHISVGGYIKTYDDIIADLDIKCEKYIKAGGTVLGRTIFSRCYIDANNGIRSTISNITAVEYIYSRSFIISGGSIKSYGCIESCEGIQSNGYIQANGYIKSGKYINAFCEIVAGGDINTPPNYLINAGLMFDTEYSKNAGFIMCPNKPKNIGLGHWVQNQ